MKKILQLGFVVAILMSQINCKSGKETQSENGSQPTVGEPKTMLLEFGSGGGVTGAYTIYIIHGDGKIFESSPEVKEMTKIF